MEVFLIVVSIIFLIFGSMLLLFPDVLQKITKATNRVLFNLADEKVYKFRRLAGILFLLTTIFLWYVALCK